MGISSAFLVSSSCTRNTKATPARNWEFSYSFCSGYSLDLLAHQSSARPARACSRLGTMMRITEHAKPVAEPHLDPESHKADGNTAFGEGRWAEAERHYTMALETSVGSVEKFGDSGGSGVTHADTPGDTPEDDDHGVSEPTELSKHTDTDEKESSLLLKPKENESETKITKPKSRARAIYFANRAACRLQLSKIKEVITDCTEAIACDGSYLKAWARRAEAKELLNPPDAEGALFDCEALLKQAAEIEKKDVKEFEKYASIIQTSKDHVTRLKPLVDAKHAQLKKEMMEKLTGLGDALLGNFGLSTKNFKAQKDESGAYSVQFVNNPT